MKKILYWVLVCLLLTPLSAQAAVSVRMEDGALLLAESGEEILPIGAYDDIAPLGGELFAAEKDGLYLLLDGTGKALTDAIYSDLHWDGEALIACRDGLWGLLDRLGEEQTDFVYGRILSSGEGKYWAVKGNVSGMDTHEILLLDPDGGERQTGLYARDLSDGASEGLLAIRLPNTGLWGYCDTKGEMTISAAFSYAGEFICGRAAIVQDGHWGAIDAGGAYIVPAEYDALEICETGFMLATRTGEAVELLDMDGQLISAYEGEECFAAPVGNGFMLYDGQDVYLCDAQGEVITAIDRKGSVYAGLNGQWIITEGAWGEDSVYLYGSEKRFQNLTPLGTVDGEALYICMQVNAARYMSDLLGEIQLAIDMDMARYGVVNADSEMIFPCEYESIEYLGNGRLLLGGDGLWEMTDRYGMVYWSYGFRQSEEPSF